jgi:hypothetical protein
MLDTNPESIYNRFVPMRIYMSLLNRRSTLAILGLLASLAATGAMAAPVYACTCNTINFSPSSSPGSPITHTTNPTTFSNTVSLETGSFGGGNNWVYVSITGITPGWTVTVTSPDTVTTLSSTQIIVGVFGASTSSFPYTITVTAPLLPTTSGQFTINAQPSQSGTTYSAVGISCAPVTVYLKTGPNFPPPNGVPEFPFGMALLMAVAIPALLLVRSKSKIIAA